MLYQAYQMQADLLSPLRQLSHFFGHALFAAGNERTIPRRLSAAMDVFDRLKLTHQRPDYGIREVTTNGEAVPVVEEKALQAPFGTLLRFRKLRPADAPAEPPVLLAAPLSGHF
ncbi:MAG: polyhydroxyalkanoate depolymerase, partial [Gammaproteobacteria bacterium]